MRRQHDKDAESASGSGWSREGMNKFGEVANLIIQDRERNGAIFNKELYKVFTNRKRTKSKADRSIDPAKQAPPIYDDMDHADWSDEDDQQEVPYVRV